MQTQRLFIGLCLAFVAGSQSAAHTLAADDWQSTGNEWIFRLTDQSVYQEGCFEPCLCPIQQYLAVRGVMKLRRVDSAPGFQQFTVDDVSFSLPIDYPGLRIIGSGRYEIGSPDPTTVMQHRMVLDLQVGNDPPQHFDSGWVPIEDLKALSIRISINGVFCWDRVIDIHALPVPPNEIHPYRLADGSTFQRGCFDPCDCPLGLEVPMAGTFGVIQLTSSLALTEFALVDVRWLIKPDIAGYETPVTGFGVYRIIGDFAPQQQLILDLVIGDEPRAHFDSGVVFGSSVSPIDVVVSMNNFQCKDTVLHVIGIGDQQQYCNSAGSACPVGTFCKTPTGHCDSDVIGVCTPMPTECPVHWDPVCGCDGKTYGNACEADAAGVSTRHLGACLTPCAVDSDCPAAPQFCKYPEGFCDAPNLFGLCTERPNACIAVWLPVCGCDGTTYGNECEADMAGVSIRHRGPCETECRPSDDGFACLQAGCSAIAEDQCIPTVLHFDVATGAITVQACDCMNFNYCHVEFGNATPFPVGECPPGQSCEVFGVDTNGDGIDDLFSANCVPTFPGACCLDIDDGPIPFDTCLTLDEASCAAEGGLFHPVNSACSEMQACCLPTPNGTSSCFDMNPMCCADSGGVPKGVGSTCSDITGCGEVCGGIAGVPCPNPDDFCKLPIGGCCCDFTGVCTPVPTGGCPEIWAPVCGCDGVTYSNECEADSSAVSIDHLGVCDLGACCSDIGGTPLPLPVCTMTTRDQCAGNFFAGEGTTCHPPSACCLPLGYGIICVETDPFCCEAFGGIPRGPNTTCTAADDCTRTCTDPDGSQCGPDEFCQFPPGTCGTDPNAPGVCTPRPGPDCTEEYNPVCGCDGVTYSNACHAHAAGVSILHEGPCANCVATRVLSDPEPTYCPGHPKTVHIILNPQDAIAIAIEDAPPAGWLVANISDGGVFDPATAKVKWGPLFAPFPPELSYEVTPLDVATLGSCFQGTVSADGFTQPICGDDCVSEHCCIDPVPLPVDTPQPPCDLCPDADCSSCVGGVCEDGRVTLCELTGYACAWRRGCNDDITGVSRSAYIWRSGECYCWNSVEHNWFPVPCNPDGQPCCDSPPPPASAELSTDSPGTLSAGSLATMDTAVHERPLGGKKERTVRIAIEAPAGTLAVALEIEVPNGVKVSSISDDGTWDADHRKVKWGPFTEALSRTVTFSYRSSRHARQQEPRPAGFKGTMSVDGLNRRFITK